MADRPKLSVVGGKAPEPEVTLLEAATAAWATLESGIKSNEIAGFVLVLESESPALTVQSLDHMRAAWLAHRLTGSYMDDYSGLSE